MPLRPKSGGSWELVCINYDHHGETTTTMQAGPGWYAITKVEPPPDVVFNPSTGMAVRCSICRVCGYVEMYAGAITDPATWKPNG